MSEADEVYARLEKMDAKLDAILDRMNSTEDMIRKLITEVKPVVMDIIPMVENLTTNPLVRMAIGGKKK